VLKRLPAGNAESKRRGAKFREVLGAGDCLADVAVITGDYGYEPNGVIHDMTNFPRITVLYFTNFGPIRYIDDDDNTTGFLDCGWRTLPISKCRAVIVTPANAGAHATYRSRPSPGRQGT
jgi:hypothetical protein